MEFETFSPRQRQVLTWWLAPETRALEAVICDGAVRSGKTLCMGLSFFLWATGCFQGAVFGLCGKTVAALRRNLLSQVLPALGELGFRWEERVSRGQVKVALGERENTFCLFGGRDEGSAALIQGVTLAGALLDEAALMPRSFVEQACARCSVPGSRLWFSCNPESPEHWFYREWIQKAEERRALYLHFTMADNPALTPQVRARYERSFSGAFYRRFVLGEWTAAQGRVYDFFDASMVRPAPEGAVVRLLRLRHRQPHVHGAVGPAEGGVVPGEGVLLRLPGPAGPEDRRGVRRRAGGAGRGAAHLEGGG